MTDPSEVVEENPDYFSDSAICDAVGAVLYRLGSVGGKK